MPTGNFNVNGAGLGQLVETLKNAPKQTVTLHCETAEILKVCQDAQRFRGIVEALLVDTPENLLLVDAIASQDITTIDEMRVAMDEAFAHHGKR